ncbi:hypothetical protein RE474_09415 [Methanolobus sediminis]|uniref:Hemolytic protein HlpA-like protein n=1 Tax=Methanolobus sediminis TaxID=3072978 RepID=A0AA51YIA5_9EURY|nr:hypothetical protein [Methanolobus sediminis]WMW24311.1 hypothetical protein RE474_09415 [Methanolobus sediminis]
MSDFHLRTPVAFIIFNRPETTKKVFAEIAKAKPPKLLVIADGPRANHPGEEEKCNAARSIINNVDWECEILTNYSDVNMGCKRRVSSGLNWVFDIVEEAIILEDDCLPHPTFFRFCDELLEKYRNDERIAMISGDNFQFGRKRTEYSYYFSRYPHIWGWASWRRSWKKYDVDMKIWPEIKKNNWLQDILENKKVVKHWTKKFDYVYDGKIDTWDTQWLFSRWINNELAILPNVNLISNIGFGPNAMHTKYKTRISEMDIEPTRFPILHPPYVIRDRIADNYTEKNDFSGQTIIHKLAKILKANILTKNRL